MWTADDLAWLAANYPQLRETESGTIEGRLSFQMLRSDGRYFVNPSSFQVQDSAPSDYLYVCDTYKIRISWHRGRRVPLAYETGGKLAGVAMRLNKSLVDMHQLGDGSLCLAAAMDLERAFREKCSLATYIEEFLVPYLFAQSHYAKTQEWLWGELSHGSLGLLEWLGRRTDCDERDVRATYEHLMRLGDSDKIRQLLSTRCRGHHPCPCGSNRKTRKCHPEVLRAIGLLRDSPSISPRQR